MFSTYGCKSMAPLWHHYDARSSGNGIIFGVVRATGLAIAASLRRRHRSQPCRSAVRERNLTGMFQAARSVRWCIGHADPERFEQQATTPAHCKIVAISPAPCEVVQAL